MEEMKREDEAGGIKEGNEKREREEHWWKKWKQMESEVGMGWNRRQEKSEDEEEERRMVGCQEFCLVSASMFDVWRERHGAVVASQVSKRPPVLKKTWRKMV